MEDHPENEPSPEQIAAICLEIQQTWTPAQRLERMRADWRPTITRVDGHVESISPQVYAEHHEAHEVLALVNC